ncbi:uncharacterized protein [Asterias amurensis]|uniref:uncharacterized protein isoform X3 n=1 Tax=Asterias amurensis TaxID=7602 RepID=UPI003AB76BCB
MDGISGYISDSSETKSGENSPGFHALNEDMLKRIRDKRLKVTSQQKQTSSSGAGDSLLTAVELVEVDTNNSVQTKIPVAVIDSTGSTLDQREIMTATRKDEVTSEELVKERKSRSRSSSAATSRSRSRSPKHSKSSRRRRSRSSSPKRRRSRTPKKKKRSRSRTPKRKRRSRSRSPRRSRSRTPRRRKRSRSRTPKRRRRSRSRTPKNRRNYASGSRRKRSRSRSRDKKRRYSRSHSRERRRSPGGSKRKRRDRSKSLSRSLSRSPSHSPSQTPDRTRSADEQLDRLECKLDEVVGKLNRLETLQCSMVQSIARVTQLVESIQKNASSDDNYGLDTALGMEDGGSSTASQSEPMAICDIKKEEVEDDSAYSEFQVFENHSTASSPMAMEAFNSFPSSSSTTLETIPSDNCAIRQDTKANGSTLSVTEQPCSTAQSPAFSGIMADQRNMVQIAPTGIFTIRPDSLFKDVRLNCVQPSSSSAVAADLFPSIVAGPRRAVPTAICTVRQNLEADGGLPVKTRQQQFSVLSAQTPNTVDAYPVASQSSCRTVQAIPTGICASRYNKSVGSEFPSGTPQQFLNSTSPPPSSVPGVMEAYIYSNSMAGLKNIRPKPPGIKNVRQDSIAKDGFPAFCPGRARPCVAPATPSNSDALVEIGVSGAEHPVLIRQYLMEQALFKSVEPHRYACELLGHLFGPEELSVSSFRGETMTQDGSMTVQLDQHRMNAILHQTELEFPGSTATSQKISVIKKAVNAKCRKARYNMKMELRRSCVVCENRQ